MRFGENGFLPVCQTSDVQLHVDSVTNMAKRIIIQPLGPL